MNKQGVSKSLSIFLRDQEDMYQKYQEDMYDLSYMPRIPLFIYCRPSHYSMPLNSKAEDILN